MTVEHADALGVLSHPVRSSRVNIQASVLGINEQLQEFPLNEHTCVTRPWKAQQRVLICNIPLGFSVLGTFELDDLAGPPRPKLESRHLFLA